jgi:hypothetical protein
LLELEEENPNVSATTTVVDERVDKDIIEKTNKTKNAFLKKKFKL